MHVGVYSCISVSVSLCVCARVCACVSEATVVHEGQSICLSFEYTCKKWAYIAIFSLLELLGLITHHRIQSRNHICILFNLPFCWYHCFCCALQFRIFFDCSFNRTFWADWILNFFFLHSRSLWYWSVLEIQAERVSMLDSFKMVSYSMGIFKAQKYCVFFNWPNFKCN